ncbi:MAG: methyltransferase domain-containing protein [Anaerolineae bacterium]|nr:methyltransferase domain-containing protein [Anaerolineae bacterium]MDW8298540.1 methyltransferase domain-containing protein [Anaerolineae bacterium]
MSALLIGVAIVLIGALVWYLFIATEGVYLGKRVVIALYDLYAKRYDYIKGFDEEWELQTLAAPLAKALGDVPQPLILDVATGTGRLPHLLRRVPNFKGKIIGLDASWQMLRVAAAKLGKTQRIVLLHQDATQLPFADETFDAVTCLEALEFLPDQAAALAEIVRVARVGAPILLTNRRGMYAWLMRGKVQPSEAFAESLYAYGLDQVEVETWQVEYDLVWAIKGGTAAKSARPQTWQAALRCPYCNCTGFQAAREQTLRCSHCEKALSFTAEGILPYAAALKQHEGALRTFD